jgi:hypothetical protein
MALQDFINGYITCAMWSSDDGSNPETGCGEPMDRNYSSDDIHPDTMEEMKKDCAKFYEANAHVFWYRPSSEYSIDECAGHDFWLTRNGHGTGFWDRPANNSTQKALGRHLTNVSKAFGEYHLWIGDHVKYGNDNKIHGEKG